MNSLFDRHTNWVKNSKNKFGNRFDYSQSIQMYKSTQKPKVKIKCIKHNQDFFVTPAHHLSYVDGGCDVCRQNRKQTAGQKTDWSFNRWKSNSIKKYGEKFDYSKSRKGFETVKKPKIIIFCREHQKEFRVFPTKHLVNKNGGCLDCVNKDREIRVKTINHMTKRSKLEEIKEFLHWFNLNKSKNLELISEIDDIRKNAVFKCKKHNNLTEHKPKILQENNQIGCKFCVGEKRRLSLQKASSELKQLLPSNISVQKMIVSKGSSTKIQLFCKTHGELEPRLMATLKKKNTIYCRNCLGLESKKKVMISENKNLMSLLPIKTKKDILALSQKDQRMNISWECKKRGHKFLSTAYKLFKSKYTCPECKIYENSLQFLYPEISKEYDVKKNKISPSRISAGSSVKVFWLCTKDSSHKYKREVYTQTRRGWGCPYCTGKQILEKDSLYALRKDLIKEWDWIKNKVNPKTIHLGSSYKAHWICAIDNRHEFINPVANRTNKDRKGGCPICAGYIVDSTNNLAKVYPKVAEFWHPTKNFDLKPQNVFCRSSTRVWWKCDKGPDHEWEGTILDRISRTQKCIFCLNQKVSVTNSLSTLFPEIAKEWHPSRNGDLSPDKILAMSGKKVWWQCKRDPKHEWRTEVAARTSSGRECPGCLPNPKSKIEIEIAAELKLFFHDIDIFDDQIFINGKKIMPDIKINSIKLIVEYDGWYWHKNRQEKDKEKTKILSNHGWKVIRLREKPLDNLDISVEFDPFNKKISMNKLLILIVNHGYLTSKKIKYYLKEKNLVNSKQYESWLEEAISGKNIFRSTRKKKFKKFLLKDES